MEIADREIFQRRGESSVEIEIKNRGRRFDSIRGRQMGRRVRSAWENPVAGFGVSEARTR